MEAVLERLDTLLDGLHKVIGLVYGISGFLLSVLSVLVHFLLAPTQPEPVLFNRPEPTMKSHTIYSHPLHPPTSLPTRIHISKVPARLSPRARKDFDLSPPLESVEESLGPPLSRTNSQSTSRSQDSQTAVATSEPSSSTHTLHHPPDMLTPKSAEVPPTFIVERPTVPRHNSMPANLSKSNSCVRLKHLITRRRSSQSTHSIESDESHTERGKSEKPTKKRHLRLGSAEKNNTKLLEPHPSPDSLHTCFRKPKSETETLVAKTCNQDRRPQPQHRPRTEPYASPYFFPSPMSPEADFYAQSVSAERHIRFATIVRDEPTVKRKAQHRQSNS